MNKIITFDDDHKFPTLSFWKELPTKSIVSWQHNETGEISKELFSHVATDTVYFYDQYDCVHQKFSYDSDSTLQDPGELEEYPTQIEFSDEAIENYVLIPIQHFDKILDDFKNCKVKLYEDYMDQGWGEVEIENSDYLYIEKGDDTISYINGEGVWMLFEDMRNYDPNYEELYGVSLCKIEDDETTE